MDFQQIDWLSGSLAIAGLVLINLIDWLVTTSPLSEHLYSKPTESPPVPISNANQYIALLYIAGYVLFGASLILLLWEVRDHVSNRFTWNIPIFVIAVIIQVSIIMAAQRQEPMLSVSNLFAAMIYIHAWIIVAAILSFEASGDENIVAWIMPPVFAVANIVKTGIFYTPEADVCWQALPTIFCWGSSAGMVVVIMTSSKHKF
jgi:hypothetical protein